MGAERPQNDQTPGKILTPRLLQLVGLALCLVVALFRNIVFEWIQGEPRLSPKDQARLERKLREIDDSEQYALIAIADGWYACLHSGRKTFYLKTGEVWKYGVTSKGEFGRYKGGFLVSNNVSYVTEFKGTYSECLKQEQIKLFNYQFLPENLARPLGEHLPRPPFNPVMR